MKRMKKILLTALLILALVATLITGVACSKEDGTGAGTEPPAGGTEAPVTQDPTWAAATYREDASFGEGAKTVYVTVKYKEYSVVWTVKTDREMLGDALVDHALIEGEEGPYGLYVKRVNGILADYDVDQSWWAVQQNGEDLMTGVDSTPIVDGASYELVYSK